LVAQVGQAAGTRQVDAPAINETKNVLDILTHTETDQCAETEFPVENIKCPETTAALGQRVADGKSSGWLNRPVDKADANEGRWSPPTSVIILL
jgi:hypothetical protein